MIFKGNLLVGCGQTDGLRTSFDHNDSNWAYNSCELNIKLLTAWYTSPLQLSSDTVLGPWVRKLRDNCIQNFHLWRHGRKLSFTATHECQNRKTWHMKFAQYVEYFLHWRGLIQWTVYIIISLRYDQHCCRCTQCPKCQCKNHTGAWKFCFSTLAYGEVHLKTYAAISNAHLFRVCKRGKLSGSCLSTLNGFGSIQLPIFLCHIGVPTFSSQNN